MQIGKYMYCAYALELALHGLVIRAQKCHSRFNHQLSLMVDLCLILPKLTGK